MIVVANLYSVIPAQAGIQLIQNPPQRGDKILSAYLIKALDSRLRGNDEFLEVY